MWHAIIDRSAAVQAIVRKKRRQGEYDVPEYPGRDAGSELAVNARRRCRKVHCRISTSLTEVTRIAPYEVIHEAQSFLLLRRALSRRRAALWIIAKSPECVRAACRRSGDVSLSFVGP